MGKIRRIYARLSLGVLGILILVMGIEALIGGDAYTPFLLAGVWLELIVPLGVVLLLVFAVRRLMRRNHPAHRLR